MAVIVEAMLGPALTLALAQRDVWCWHASAVLIDGRAVAFLGESGQGKSTLARWLNQQNRETWQRIGDDILPVAAAEDGVDVLPHFPQLKVAADKQPSLGLPERIPLAAVYVLGRPAHGTETEIAINPLSAQEGALALVRHTVASRLFDADLLTKQLDFCVQAAADIPLRQLIYPLRAEALPLVEQALRQDLRSGRVTSDLLAAPQS
jgi:hypothetical protein